MKAIVLSVDAAPQVQPGAGELPASLLPIRGEPLLLHTLRWLKRYDVTEIALALEEHSEPVGHLVGDGSAYGLNVVYAVESRPRGTAGVLHELGPFFDDMCVILYGQLLLDVDLGALLDYHRRRNALITIALKHTDDPQAAEMVECDSLGEVVRFAIHPASWQSEQRTASTGLYLAEPDILQHIPVDRPFDWEEHLLPLLVAQDQAVYGQLVDQPVVDIRTPAAYERVKDTGLA